MTAETKINPRDITAIRAKCADYGFISAEVVGRICADYERLRVLIKEREMWAGSCPWCGHMPRHSDKCPAFTPDGEVR